MNTVTEKIKKLLSLANSDNQNEAELASKKAGELLIKHNLKMTDVESSVDGYSNDVLADKSRMSTEDKFILSILRTHFFVEIVKSRRMNKTRLSILGKQVNVDVARYVYSYLTRTFQEIWRQYKKDTDCNSKLKQSFYMGLYKGLNSQLNEARKNVEQETGLVVVKDMDLERFKRNEFGRVRSTVSRVTTNKNVADQGYEAGRSIRIKKGLDGQSSQSGRYLRG